MHQRARTDLCGGRGATRVPTATEGNADLVRSALSSRLPRMRNAPSPICTTSRRPQTSRRRHDERTAWAPALAALTYPAISAEFAAPCRLRDGQCATFFLVLDIAT